MTLLTVCYFGYEVYLFLFFLSSTFTDLYSVKVNLINLLLVMEMCVFILK